MELGLCEEQKRPKISFVRIRVMRRTTIKSGLPVDRLKTQT